MAIKYMHFYLFIINVIHLKIKLKCIMYRIIQQKYFKIKVNYDHFCSQNL